jgi:hypothetical protein
MRYNYLWDSSGVHTPQGTLVELRLEVCVALCSLSSTEAGGVRSLCLMQKLTATPWRRASHCLVRSVLSTVIVRANPLKTKLVYILFKNPVRTSKRTPYFTTTKINWLTLFKEIIVNFNPLKTKLVYILFKNPVRTSKRTPHFTITKINCLTLFNKIIPVYSENHTKPINTKCSITDCQSRWFI